MEGRDFKSLFCRDEQISRVGVTLKWNCQAVTAPCHQTSSDFWTLFNMIYLMFFCSLWRRAEGPICTFGGKVSPQQHWGQNAILWEKRTRCHKVRQTLTAGAAHCLWIRTSFAQEEKKTVFGAHSHVVPYCRIILHITYYVLHITHCTLHIALYITHYIPYYILCIPLNALQDL